MKYFLAQMDETGTLIPVGLSMVQMKNNCQEAEDLVNLAARLRGELAVEIHLNFQVKDHCKSPQYSQLRAAQNIDSRDPVVHTDLLAAVHRASEVGVEIFYSSTGPLKNVLKALE